MNNNGVGFARESGDTYKLTLPDGTIKTGLTLKKAADMAEEALAKLRKVEENHENGNDNNN